jgi:histidinol-phosphate aminotransferase
VTERARRVTSEDHLAPLVTSGLRGMTAYHVPRPGGIRAKLDANELPYGLPPEVAEALGAELARVAIERYPDAGAGELRDVIARTVGVDPASLVFGNGSDELIAMLCAAFGEPRDAQARATVLYPVPTFGVYRIAALAHHLEPVEIALGDDFTLDGDAVERGFAERRPNLAFFALPNNPTGTLWSPELVLALARRYPDTIVVADEAYIEYGGRTLLPYVGMPRNLVVMRTLSKTGMAGLRCGFLTAATAIVRELEKVRPPYNLGSLPMRAAAWLVDHHGDALRAMCRAVVAERPRLAAALAAIPGVHVFDSEANLVLVRIGVAGDGAATRVWNELIARGVLVRNFDRPGPLAGCLRITVGTPVENDLLVASLRDILG